MIKLLIADDEPLVCVGLQSMLEWGRLGIEVVGTARNGEQAMQLIEQLSPEIVITDIRMPLKSGLEVAEECAEKYGRIPLFIVLTSYEEFDLVRKAIKVQAVDYLIKLELSPQSLEESVKKALAIAGEYRRAQAPVTAQRSGLQAMREKFFIRLYNNLFDSEEQYLAQKEDLAIDFSVKAFTAVNCEIVEPENAQYSAEKLLSMCGGTVQMVRETLGKTHRCYITTMDMRHFSIAFCLESGEDSQLKGLEASLQKTVALVRSYFSIALHISVGTIVEDPRALSESYLAARRTAHRASELLPVVFSVPAGGEGGEPETEFEFSTIRPDIRRAFEELDTAALYTALSGISQYYATQPQLRIQAMDAACNVLYMAITLLPDGQKTVDHIFQDNPEGYRGIYRLSSTEAIVSWLDRLRDGCCELLSSRRQNYRQKVIAGVQEYIRQNLNKRLSLNDVAAVFNFNPSYLSQLFAKYADCGFVEYITTARVEAAKELLAHGDGRINEISEQLGFESPFYFSKVFKKYAGVSPRDYQQSL